MIHRRSFLRHSAAAAATPALMGATQRTAAILTDPADPLAHAPPVQWAVGELERALKDRGYRVRHLSRARSPVSDLTVLILGSQSEGAAVAMRADPWNKADLVLPNKPESFLVTTVGHASTPILATSADARGLMYAVLELADRVRYGATALGTPSAQHPANAVRSVMRQFTSEVYDKPWFYDRAMWPEYLGTLAAARFNRFDLTFGLGYDFLSKVADPYFVFLYPFLMAVPGYDVKVTNLSQAERDHNLATLKYIGEQAAAHGLDFQLGVWMHGYKWKDTPDAKYVIAGLTPENHATYCRDAMTALLKAVPAISSVGLRIHGESGVAEGSYDFWKAVFVGVTACGRKVELDLHAKGIDDKMIENALATGLPVNISPKFAAEHLGLPYHQADIRPSEIPAPGQKGEGLMLLSAGQRSFTRYGYADLLRDDRLYSVRTRVFYGTQRILASGGAEWAAAYGRAFGFCGMTGGELMEPLTFRGRRGSAIPGTRRSGYLAAKLEPKYDWQKYDAWYRSWGRMLFDPSSDPEECRRSFEPGKARALETALAAASRILPLVTHAVSESAACDLYWPEVYWNMLIASEAPKSYWDTPSPRTFQNVTALDPQLFSTCTEFAGELMDERSGKYSPTEVAALLESHAAAVAAALKAAEPSRSIEQERLAIDAEIQRLLGLFFAAKLRAGVLYALFERTHQLAPLTSCQKEYRGAREHWAKIVARAKGAYAADLSISDRVTERGTWADRLADIDADLARLDELLRPVPATLSDADRAVLDRLVRSANVTIEKETPASLTLVAPKRGPLPCQHTPPASYVPGKTVDLGIAVREGLTRATMWYRHVNQAERWTAADMTAAADAWHGSIPAAYTASPFPLQYYFEFRAAPDQGWIYPGFNEDLSNQPYILLQRA